jgi:hypothetical protein
MSDRPAAKQHELIVGPITIREIYSRWSPPIDASKTVARLIEGLPSQYLVGIRTIVLTDAAGLNHEERRAKTWTRGKKVPIRQCRGLYHHASNMESAWIELFVDNIVISYPSGLLRIPLLADMEFSEVLFHEIGHHIHKTQAPEFKEPEDVAEAWEKRLRKIYFRRRYRYLILMAYVLYPLFWLKKKLGSSKGAHK